MEIEGKICYTVTEYMAGGSLWGAVTEKAKKRYEEIDLCRGFGILLVVLGHALKQTGETNPVFETVNAVIYSFICPCSFSCPGLWP